MHSIFRTAALNSALLLFAVSVPAATITGTVKGPDGAPFQGAFVQAEDIKMNMMMSVLSNEQGHYRLDNLPAGEYKIQIHAVGYKADPHADVNLTADQKASFDFSLQPGTVHWTDISANQAAVLLPDKPGKDTFIHSCAYGCHSFQNKIAPYRLDESGWRDKVNYMKYSQKYFLSLGTTPDAKFDDAVRYMSAVFSPDSDLPDSPADVPGYKQTVRHYSEAAMNIVYVEFNTPPGNPPQTHSRMPWSAWYDEKHGQVLVPYISGNGFGRMDLKTGKVDEYYLPLHPGYTSAGVGFHSVVSSADGTLWFTEQGMNSIGKWDPSTKEFTEYQDGWTPGKEYLMSGGKSKHTVRVDSKGVVWISGAPLSKFDPKTKEYTHYDEVPDCYQIFVDKDDNAWFTEMRDNGGIGKVDAKTGKVVKYPYHDFRPHRLTLDAQGMVWFNGRGDKLVRFDPKTEKFTDFPLPGPNVGTYGIGYDLDGGVWYNSEHIDELGRLDPKTGKVVEYPFPQSENEIKELLIDNHNRIWFASPTNNKFGYFYIARNTESAAK